jgi:hypothetical protein
VINRLKLTWDGQEPSTNSLDQGRHNSTSVCQTLVLIVVLQFAVIAPLTFLFFALEPRFDPENFHPSQEQLQRDAQSAFLLGMGDIILRYASLAFGTVLVWKEPSLKKGVIKVACVVSAVHLIKVVFGLDIHFNELYATGNVYAFLFSMYLYDLAVYSFMTVTVMIIRNVRRYVRAKYAIPPFLFAAQNSRDLSGDDCLMACCCSCCTTAQMLRHTTDYYKYRSSICSDKGVPYGTPGIL